MKGDLGMWVAGYEGAGRPGSCSATGNARSLRGTAGTDRDVGVVEGPASESRTKMLWIRGQDLKADQSFSSNPSQDRRGKVETARETLLQNKLGSEKQV